MWRWGLEVQKEHVTEKNEEGKVHDDIPHEHSDWSAPETIPLLQHHINESCTANLHCRITSTFSSTKKRKKKTEVFKIIFQLHCSFYLLQKETEAYTRSSSVSNKACTVSKLSSSSNGSPSPWLTLSSALWHTHTHNWCTMSPKIRLNVTHGNNHVTFPHLNLTRLVQTRGGMKNVSTSLAMEVSVLMAPHQTLVSRACAKVYRLIMGIWLVGGMIM